MKIDLSDTDDRWPAFISASTRLQHPPRVPELQLHLADEMTPIWQLTEAELGKAGIEPPFWAFAWAGGQAVARHLLDTAAEVAGRRVLDVASGSGLVALAACRAGALAATALDLDPVAGAATRLNAERNGLSRQIAVRTGDVLDALADPGVLAGIDLVTAGDVCYDRDMTPRVLALLRAARGRGIRVLLGDPGRGYLPLEELTLLATYDVPTTADLEGREICPSSVYELLAD